MDLPKSSWVSCDELATYLRVGGGGGGGGVAVVTSAKGDTWIDAGKCCIWE